MKRKNLTWVTVVLFCSVLICCKSPFSGENTSPSKITIKVDGYVTNASDGSPIEGAMVSIWTRMNYGADGLQDYEGGHAHTDIKGYFKVKFKALECDGFRVSAIADGFENPMLGFPKLSNSLSYTDDLQTIHVKLEPKKEK